MSSQLSAEKSRRALVRTDAGVVSRRLGDGMVLVQLPSNKIFELNETGARIWDLLSKGSTVDEVVRQLVAEFEADETEIQSSVSELIGRLSSEGLLAL